MTSLVSVIIPTYKRYDLLPNALNSILQQTYKNIEVIVIDDNAPESNFRKQTASVMEEYLLKYKNVKYVTNEKNSGVTFSRNRGIDLSNGEYITFLDDDDIYLNNKVEEQLSYMVNNSLDLCFCDGAVFDENDNLLKEKKRNFPDGFLSREDLIKFHIKFHLTGTNTMMYQASFLRKIGGFDNVGASEEFYLTSKAIDNGAKIGNVDKPLTKTILHKGEHLTYTDKKIQSTIDLYLFKKKYFYLLSKKEIRFVKSRHYLSIAYSYLKMNKKWKAIQYALKSAFVSLINTVNFFKENMKKI